LFEGGNWKAKTIAATTIAAIVNDMIVNFFIAATHVLNLYFFS
jgi:hypothetical protein